MQDITSRLTVWHLKNAYHVLLKEYLSHVSVIQRLDRAYDILTRDDRYIIEAVSNTPLTFLVTGPNGQYTVIDSQRLCNCPDSEALCKHRLAVKLITLAATAQTAEGMAIEYRKD